MTNWTEYFRIQQSMSFLAVTVFIFLHSAVSALVIITGCQSQTAGCWQNLASILHMLNQEGNVHLYWYWQRETLLDVSSQWAAVSCGVCGCDIQQHIKKMSPEFIDQLVWSDSIETTKQTFLHCTLISARSKGVPVVTMLFILGNFHLDDTWHTPPTRTLSWTKHNPSWQWHIPIAVVSPAGQCTLTHHKSY